MSHQNKVTLDRLAREPVMPPKFYTSAWRVPGGEWLNRSWTPWFRDAISRMKWRKERSRREVSRASNEATR